MNTSNIANRISSAALGASIGLLASTIVADNMLELDSYFIDFATLFAVLTCVIPACTLLGAGIGGALGARWPRPGWRHLLIAGIASLICVVISEGWNYYRWKINFIPTDLELTITKMCFSWRVPQDWVRLCIERIIKLQGIDRLPIRTPYLVAYLATISLQLCAYFWVIASVAAITAQRRASNPARRPPSSGRRIIVVSIACLVAATLLGRLLYTAEQHPYEFCGHQWKMPGGSTCRIDISVGRFEFLWFDSDAANKSNWHHVEWNFGSRSGLYLVERCYGRASPSAPMEWQWRTHINGWLVVMILLLLPLRGVYSFARARFAVQPGFCRKCGYDLRASSASCPECGEPIPAKDAKLSTHS